MVPAEVYALKKGTILRYKTFDKASDRHVRLRVRVVRVKGKSLFVEVVSDGIKNLKMSLHEGNFADLTEEE